MGFIFFLLMLLVTFYIGNRIQRNHEKSIAERQIIYRDLAIDNLKEPPAEAEKSFFVCGEMVLAVDAYRTFISTLKQLIGGEIKSFYSIMARARREAILRLLADAKLKQADGVCNIRVESADVAGTSAASGKQGNGRMVAIIVTGTAYRLRK